MLNYVMVFLFFNQNKIQKCSELTTDHLCAFWVLFSLSVSNQDFFLTFSYEVLCLTTLFHFKWLSGFRQVYFKDFTHIIQC
jgi:hypothetical protein